MEKQAALSPDVVLQPHQERVVSGVSPDAPVRKLLAHTVGSGKSLSSIAAAEAFGRPYSVVAPASLRNNYRGELAKFTDQQTPTDVVSYTALAKGNEPKFTDSVVFDEAARLRNPNSLQTRAAIDLARKAQQVLLLSGTPIPNNPEDFAPALSILTGKNVTPEEFKKRYVGTKHVSPGVFGWLLGARGVDVPEVKHRDELKALLQGKVDWYETPNSPVPTDREEVVTDMSKDQARVYKAMWDELPWLIKWKMKHDYPLSNEELARARSFLTGPRQVGLSLNPYMGGKSPYAAFARSGKLTKAYELLRKELDTDPRAKAIVYSNFVNAGLTPYAAALERNRVPHIVFHGAMGDEARRAAVDDFNAGKARVALVGPAGAEGISLRGAQLTQILDAHWNEARNRQAEARGLRYDSHVGLPDELRRMKVQRFVARLPLGFKERLLAAVGADQTPKTRAADDYLKALSERKDDAIRPFLDLLREVGTAGHGKT